MLKTQWCFSCCWAVVTDSQRLFYCLCCSVNERELRVHKELGRNAARTVGPSWLKWYPMPHGVILNKTGMSWLGSLLLLVNWLGLGQLVLSNCIVYHLLWGFCLFVLVLSSFFFFFSSPSSLLNWPYLSPWVLALLFSLLSPILLVCVCGGGSRWTTSWCLAACQVKAQQCFPCSVSRWKGWSPDHVVKQD